MPVCIFPFARLSTASALCKNRRSAVPKITTDRSKALTYEQAQYPEYIGVRKSWNSWNTSNLDGESKNASQTTVEDVFIRKFMSGTWHGLFVSELIIKRRHNLIIIAGIINQTQNPTKIYFLKGYTEELLSHLFRRPIRIEVQTVQRPRDVHFKWI